MEQYIGNRGGIPIITATQSNAGSTTTNAVYSFPNHVFRFVSNKGIMIGDFSAASDTTVTGVSIVSNSITLPLLNSTNEALTTLTAGLHILLFNKDSNSLNLVV